MFRVVIVPFMGSVSQSEVPQREVQLLNVFTETTKILLICLFAQLMKTDCETRTVSICVMLL